MSYYEVVIYLPMELLEKMQDEINQVMHPIYPDYDFVFSFMKVSGTWRPHFGAHPYQGIHDQIMRAEEYRLEFTVMKADLVPVLQKIRSIHPYEEPVIEVYPIQSYKEILDSHFTN